MQRIVTPIVVALVAVNGPLAAEAGPLPGPSPAARELAAPGATGRLAPPTDAQAREAVIPDAAPAPAFDLDRAIAGVLEEQTAVLLQRTRTRPPRRTSGGGNPTLAWAGIGMLAVGGILAINGAVSTCGVSISSDFRDVSTSPCWTRAGVGAGVGALGAFLFMKNR